MYVILKCATWPISQLRHACVCEWLTIHKDCSYLAGECQKHESGPNFRRKSIFAANLITVKSI